ncbi:IclR family transcriptional regulator [Altererythrobacter sp. GH1-8]|uniref:IclR family transcriptional regulator n=1 Tax=Altererythrobacter sp. GH1-8 TaxID=3349333 RepID=UPI00374D8654
MSTVKSADRVFMLLELFARRRCPLTASEICAETGWPLSSTTALLKSLAKGSYFLQSERGKKYFPSVRLNALTRWIEDEVFATGSDVRALMSAMRDQYGETTTLSVRRGLSMEFVEIMLGTNTVVMNVDPGDTFSLFGSAVGTAALAVTTPKKMDELWQTAKKLGQVEDSQFAEINRRVTLCRKQGYYAGYDQAIDGLGALAFPLTRVGSASTYVFAIAGLTPLMQEREQRIAEEVLATLANFVDLQ